MTIFSDFAPLYWAAGLPVIPLKKWNDKSKGAGKAPILSEWTAYGRSAPSRATQELWLHSYPDNNIGLPFGPASGLCAIDIDSDDPDVTDVILDALPPSPWMRVGKKGMGLIYRWSGQKNFKLRNSDNQSIVEFLGFGNQMVMPPSIHPETGKPYVADTNLWEVMDQIVELPGDVEKVLRDALGLKGMTLAHSGRSKPLEVVPEGERDIQMVRHAGYLARVVLGIDKSAKFTLLEAIQHMHTWVSDFTARVAGDSMDPDKGVAKLLEFLMNDVEKGKTLPDGWDDGLSNEWLEHPTIAAIRGHNEVARWDVRKAHEWLEQKNTDCDGDARVMYQRVFELIDLLARDENFTDMEYGAVCTKIQKLLGKDFAPSKPDLRRAFRDARSGDSATEATDQAELAQYVLERLNREGEIRWSSGFFWQWNGSCFQKLDDASIMTFIMREARGNILARRGADYKAIRDIMQLHAHAPLVEEFEPGVNFANGYLSVDGVLHEHSPKWGATFTLPFEYIPARAGECHKWLEYLERTWGDEPDYADRVAALQEAFAVTMFGMGTAYQRAILLFGKADSGKSVALKVLQAMMPEDAVSKIPPHTWREKYVMAELIGKTLNICGELPESKGIDGSSFKEIIDGTGRQVERKFRDPFDMKPVATHWFASNYLPKTRDTSRGFSRRWLILNYERVVPVEERIPNFEEVLIADEREAIAAWAIQGMARVQKNRGFTLPESHHRVYERMVRANNSVAAWLMQTEKVVAKEGAVAEARECFDQYQFYTKDVARGFYVSFERFKEMVDELGFHEETFKDPMGVTRFQFRGLEVVEPSIEKKWARPED